MTIYDKIIRMNINQMTKFLHHTIGSSTAEIDKVFCNKLCKHRTNENECEQEDCLQLNNDKTVIRKWLESEG